MSTLTEIEEAIEMLPVAQVDQLASWLEKRRRKQPAWPVPPPNVERAELERIEAEIEAEFPTLRAPRARCGTGGSAVSRHLDRCAGVATQCRGRES